MTILSGKDSIFPTRSRRNQKRVSPPLQFKILFFRPKFWPISTDPHQARWISPHKRFDDNCKWSGIPAVRGSSAPVSLVRQTHVKCTQTTLVTAYFLTMTNGHLGYDDSASPFAAGDQREVLHEYSTPSPMGIAAVPRFSADVTNGCRLDNGGCSQLCLFTPSGVTCHLPSGKRRPHVLSGSGRI